MNGSSTSYYLTGDHRLSVVRQLVELFEPIPDDSHILVRSVTPLLSSSDFPFVLARVVDAVNESNQRVWSVLARSTCDLADPENFDQLLSVGNQIPVLASVIQDIVGPIEIHSKEADQWRLAYESERAQQSAVERNSAKMLERIRDALQLFQMGGPRGYWEAQYFLAFVPNKSYIDEDEPDLTKLPLWVMIPADDQKQLLDGARIYLEVGDPENATWLGIDQMCRPARAGYRALLLLWTHDRAGFATLSPSVWKRWAAAVIAYPLPLNVLTVEEHGSLVAGAYQHATEELLRAAVCVLARNGDETLAYQVLFRLRLIWDRRVEEILLGAIKGNVLTATSGARVIGELLSHRHRPTQQWTEIILRSALQSERRMRGRALQAAAAVLRYAAGAGWSYLWPIFSSHPAAARRIVNISVQLHEYGVDEGWPALEPEQLIALYEWLTNQTADRRKGSDLSDQARHFQSALLDRVKSFGTWSAWQALDHLSKRRPGDGHLNLLSLETRYLVRQATWRKPAPEQVLLLARNPDARLIETADQLQSIVLESLHRLEQQLHGELPAVVDLWNRWGDKVTTLCRPVDENAFSDYVARHLKRDLTDRGIVLNREVEIRRGQKVDINIDAVLPGRTSQGKPLRVIVEAKGCWHKDLKTAMCTQLVETYLRNNTTQHGIYLVR